MYSALANFWLPSRLFNVSLDVPATDGLLRSPRKALSVELCQCPVNYEGKPKWRYSW